MKKEDPQLRKVKIKEEKLENSNLTMLKPYAISNEALGNEFTFKCFSGCCGLYIVFD